MKQPGGASGVSVCRSSTSSASTTHPSMRDLRFDRCRHGRIFSKPARGYAFTTWREMGDDKDVI